MSANVFESLPVKASHYWRALTAISLFLAGLRFVRMALELIGFALAGFGIVMLSR